ncbi:tail terminator [Arthrobacter phage Kepler]|uniref:Tail terminator n=8 Tax=Coralvirus TaxID=2733171 RepID=A0A5J6TRU3_9CAUD|nr:tail terminator [Arthrobacter phage Coral]YP_009815841.1 tail terminator [Arthrobacter phage Kepler]AYN57587.1 tail terminator [Arthrobacter phage Cote]AYN57662.1 tail terminator [Arthrobacter phage Daob]AYN58421.1 tail terminator [Arthrobacter phage Lunar]AYN58563.1 tail terminator [Arthrobacter phage Melons]AYN58769.1 tail terminator [Arthrobacter phage Polka]QFG13068.1 tail terminator [Arthrobacter phage Amelia]
MVEVVEPADGESAAIQYLAAALGSEAGFEDVAVVGSLPAAAEGYEPPAEAVVVRLTGFNPRDQIVDVHQLTLTAWAAAPGEEIRACDIARRAGALIRAAELLGSMAGVTCSRVQTYSFYNDPDPVTGRARYSATYAVSLRGQIVRAS